MQNLHVRKIEKIEHFEELGSSWDALLKQSPTQSAFLTWDWLYSWWNVYGEGKRLWIVSIWDGDNLVGLAPLMIEPRNKFGVRLKTLVNLGTPQSDVGGFLYRKEDTQVLNLILHTIFEHEQEWDILELNEFTAEAGESNLLRNFSLSKNLAHREEKNAHYFVTLERDWDVFSKKLSKKFMHNLRRALKLSESLGNVEIRHYTKEKVTDNLLNEIIECNSRSNYPRLYNSKEEQALLKQLIINAKDNLNWLDVYILYINDRAVAYEYGFVYEQRFESWRAGIDLSLPPNISIGKLLAMKVVQKCIAEGYTEIDFLRGDEAYKQEWKPNGKGFTNFRFFNKRNLFAYFAYLWLEYIKPLLKRAG